MLVEVVGEALVILLLAKLSFTAFGETFVPSNDEKDWHGFRRGLEYIGQDKILVALLSFGVLANLALSAVIIGEPVVLLQQQHLSTQVYGWIEASLALAMISGSALMGVFSVTGATRSYTAKVGFLITLVFVSLFGRAAFVDQCSLCDRAVSFRQCDLFS